MSNFISKIGAVFIWKVIGIGIGFISQILLARILGVEDYGKLIYIITWVGILSLVAKVGFDDTAIKFVSGYIGNKKWNLLNGFIVTAFATTLIAILLVLVIGYCIITVTSIVPKEYVDYLPWICGLLPVMVFQNISISALKGLGAQGLAEFIDSTFRPFILLIGLTIIWCSVYKVNINYIMMTIFCVWILAVVFSAYFVKRIYPIRWNECGVEYKYREWFSASIALWLSGGINLIQSKIDILMLGMMASPVEVGYYSVASKISGLLVIGLASVNVVIAPKIANLYASNQPKTEIQKYLSQAAGLLLVFSLLAGGLLIISGKLLLSIFGDNFFTSIYTNDYSYIWEIFLMHLPGQLVS